MEMPRREGACTAPSAEGTRDRDTAHRRAGDSRAAMTPRAAGSHALARTGPPPGPEGARDGDGAAGGVPLRDERRARAAQVRAPGRRAVPGQPGGPREERNFSEETARAIDAEVRAAVTAAYERGRALLKERLQVLHRIAERLLDRETLERADLEAIVRAPGAPGRDGVPARRGALEEGRAASP
ncbi:hypothetical protein WME94_50140 [Sorangium sp. So ce429]